jgi:hypothetical protein
VTYVPSGNPATGAEGLSALMRSEFAAIAAAFTQVAAISTTGLFSTIFVQTGNYTFTLPSAAGTLATTANVATETARAEAAEALLAPKASPGLTGTPTAPTAAPGTNTTQLATTAFSTAAVSVEVTACNTAIAVETTRAEAAEALLAPKASPGLTGTPTAPTAAALTNTTQLATTAFTTAAVAVETARATTAEMYNAVVAASASAAAQATASAALPQAGGTMTGPVTLTDTTIGSSSNPIGSTTSSWFFEHAGASPGAAAGYCATTTPLSLGIGTTAAGLLNFYFGSTSVGSVGTNGTTTAYNTTSDYRLKVTFGRADGALIQNIIVHDAEWRALPGQRYPMVLAHELAELAPWAVTGKKDAVTWDGDIVPQMIDASKLIPALIAYVQGLERRLAAMEAAR